MPRRQVYITVITRLPNASGTHAPSNILSRFALKNVTSTNTNGMIKAQAASGDQRHTFHTTIRAIIPSATIVPLTAMP